MQQTLHRLSRLHLGIYMHIHTFIQLRKKDLINLKERKEENMRGYRGRKGKGK